MILTFDDVGTGLKNKDGDKLEEFAIAGADKKWVWAEAKIVGKNKVEVSSPTGHGAEGCPICFQQQSEKSRI